MDPIFVGTRFAANGKDMVAPLLLTLEAEPALQNTLPRPLRVSRARSLIRTFLATNRSQHSGRGNSVWVLVEFCKEKMLPYALTGTPSEGYCMEGLF
jgi:hypothetical protein